MKNDIFTSRRAFLGSLALGTAASGLSMMTNPLNAVTSFDAKTLNEADEWFKGVKGTHRIVYHGPTPHGGFPVIWNWAFYMTNNGTGTADEDMTAMTVLRHSGLPLAFEDRLWEKYKLGSVFDVKDNTKEHALRNPYYEPQEGDFPLPGIDGIKRLQERGAMFAACDLATKIYSNAVATEMGLDPTEVYNDWVSGVLPG